MNTDDLITQLSHNLPAADKPWLSRLLMMSCAVGAGFSLLVLLVFYGVRSDLSSAILAWPFWMKWTYAITLMLCAYLLIERLARPGLSAGKLWLLPLLPVALLTVVAIRTQLSLPAEARLPIWLGHSARYCPWNIGLLSIPIFAVLCRSLRRAAPTHLRLAAVAAGLLSGAIAAFIYGLYCNESSVAFVTTWYTLGMLLPAAYGLLFGDKLLRWR